MWWQGHATIHMIYIRSNKRNNTSINNIKYVVACSRVRQTKTVKWYGSVVQNVNPSRDDYAYITHRLNALLKT